MNTCKLTIKAIKEKYHSYQIDRNEKNMFVTYDFGGSTGKVVIVVNSHPNKAVGKQVTQVVRVADGKELISKGRYRHCDNLDDAIDVADEMMQEE